jgi:DEAD/DEAH box helicase domain-containing protein
LPPDWREEALCELQPLWHGADAVAELVSSVATEPRAGTTSDWPAWVDPRLIAALRNRGVDRPYDHQVRALEHVRAGRDLVLATATSSGKSLCYQVPIVQMVLEDAQARALLLHPTKALTRDQTASLRDLSGEEALRGCVGVGEYDGDTPPDRRRASRARAHVIASNPDMLHRGILPNHDRWSRFLAGLRLIVIDEMHTYRGLFGSHVANVLRRLLRVCKFHGSTPQLIACSATIANPGELARALIGRESAPLVLGPEEDTSPRGSRRFIVINPAVVDEVTGVRRSALTVSRLVADVLRRRRVPTIAFCRTRKAVELLTRYLREDEVGIPRRRGGPPDAARVPVRELAFARAKERIRAYRGGYLPDHRRAIEAALRDGQAEFVASTNALELGMDIGGLDAVLLCGYPGTRAATWQRSGRAGRRNRSALTVLVLGSRPTEQFLAAVPGFLFDAATEHARVDPDNPEVCVPHLRCAAYELPFSASAETWGTMKRDVLRRGLELLADAEVLHRDFGIDGEPTYHAIAEAHPADAVDLRGPLEENFTIVDEGDATGSVLAEVDFEDGPLYLHPGAIYPMESETYEVRTLDYAARKAYVRTS